MSDSKTDPNAGVAAKTTARMKSAIGDETVKWISRLIGLVLIVVCTAIITIPLKWALGIYRIENYLDEMISGLSLSEDTVFVYQFDFVVAQRDLLENIARRMQTSAEGDVAAVLQTITPFALLTKPLVDLSALRNHIEDEDWQDIMAQRGKLRSSKVHSVNFSASEKAQVTLDYRLVCYGEDGTPFPSEVAFDIKINTRSIQEDGIRLPPTGWQHIDQTLLDNFVSIKSTDSDYVHRKHELALVIENENREDIINAMAEGTLATCRFDALIFVRDVFEKFDKFDALEWIKDRTGL